MEQQKKNNHHETLVKTISKSRRLTYCFCTDDALPLAETLNTIAYKWEEIAISLRLSKVARVECGNSSSLQMKLHNVLEKWIEQQHSSKVFPTLQNLKDTLAGAIVQESTVASQLQEQFFMKRKILPGPTMSHYNPATIYKAYHKDILTRRYLEDPNIPPHWWPPVGTRTFINLALITPEENLLSNYSVYGNPDDILAKKEKVDYKEIFEEYEGGLTVLVVGRPGSGKTTLVHKLCKDWARGELLRDAELVYYISLRMLNSAQKRTSVCDILQPCYYKQDSISVAGAIEEELGRGVCFILDGFDEYQYREETGSVVYAMLNKSYLPQAMIIVSSRPAAASANVRNMPSLKKLEVFGFTREQIYEYIDSYPFGQSLSTCNLDTEGCGSNLKNYLQSHPRVLDMCYLPVNSTIICFLYANDPKNMPQTLTKVYKHFTRSILLRQLMRDDQTSQLHALEDLGEIENKHFRKLCNLALDMSIQSQQLVSQGVVDHHDFSLGLVTIDIMAQLNGFQNTYSFLHLTLQEFLAAYHISKLSLNEQAKIIDKHSDSAHMLTVWKFYFGLVTFEMNDQRAKKIFDNVQKCVSNVKLFKLQCAHESRQESICSLASSKHFVFSSSDILKPSDLSALAYVMSTNATNMLEATDISGTAYVPTTALEFSYCRLDNDKVNALIVQLKNGALICLEKLVIQGGTVSGATLAVLFKRLQQSRLKTLALTFQGYGLDTIRTLFSDSKLPRDLTHLNLSRNWIHHDGAEFLAKGLSRSDVKNLDLSWNMLGDKGVKALVTELTFNSELQSLSLFSNNISGYGAQEILDILQYNTTLLELDLSYNYVGRNAKGLLSIGKLKLGISLKKLILSSNLIDLKTATAIADYAINSCNSLVHLDLSYNDIGSDGVIEICLKLLHHAKLETLNLSTNICEKRFISNDHKSTTLDLSHNRIGIMGAVTLALGIQEVAHLHPSLLYRRPDLLQYSIPVSLNLSGNCFDKDSTDLCLLDALKVYNVNIYCSISKHCRSYTAM